MIGVTAETTLGLLRENNVPLTLGHKILAGRVDVWSQRITELVEFTINPIQPGAIVVSIVVQDPIDFSSGVC